MIKAISVALVISLLLCTFVACNSTEIQDYEKDFDVEIKPETTTTEPVYELAEDVNPLTGIANLSEGAKGKRPVAIMVANTPEAGPQWGMMTPDLTIEGLIEENKMGMMWVYADYTKIPNQVGPIAPSDSSFADIAQDMNAIYVHWDGETSEDIDNIDGAKYNGTYFFHDSSKSLTTEYQRATSQSYIQSAISIIGYQMSHDLKDYAPYRVAVDGAKLPKTEKKGKTQFLSLTFAENIVYNFLYNEEDKLYYNSINDVPLTDEKGNQKAYRNVVYLFVETEVVDGKVKWNFGKEGVYQELGASITDGMGQQIFWKIDSETHQLKIYDAIKKPLELNPGNTWIGIVPIANRKMIHKCADRSKCSVCQQGQSTEEQN